MREIKFRAWYQEKMYLWKVHNKAMVNFLLIPGNYIGVELMQFTGLKDKNGKEIYEGDIVFWADRRFDVIWEKDHFIMKSRIEGLGSVDWWNECEVIGNKFENPELLK